MMDIVEQIEAILGRATQDFDGNDEVLRRAADEIKTLRAASAVGYLFDNEDTGREFAEQHPVESAEVPDATNVVPATASELLAEVLSAWRELEQLRQRERDGFVVVDQPLYPDVSPSSSSGQLRFAKVSGDTLLEMRNNIRKEPLYMCGDTVLVWVNQSDLINHQIIGMAREVEHPKA
jgi:hypothetical protein